MFHAFSFLLFCFLTRCPGKSKKSDNFPNFQNIQTIHQIVRKFRQLCKLCLIHTQFTKLSDNSEYSDNSPTYPSVALNCQTALNCQIIYSLTPVLSEFSDNLFLVCWGSLGREGKQARKSCLNKQAYKEKDLTI